MLIRWGPILLLTAAVSFDSGYAVLAQDKQDGEVHEVKDLPYYDGPEADPAKHKLDLYFPRQAKKVPVLMWIHGGAWAMGDRAWFGGIGRRFAEQGIGVAVISYRL